MELNSSDYTTASSYPPMIPSQNTDSSESMVDWAKVVFSILICFFGIIGNAISIFIIVVLKEYKKSVLHMYVLQLAIADIAFLLTLPFKIHEDVYSRWTFPEWMCTAKETLLFLNYNASVMFLIVMSIDRYIAVCHSFSARLKRVREPGFALIVICLVWVIALLSCIPVINNTHNVGQFPMCRCRFEFPVLDEKSPEEQCKESYRNNLEPSLCVKMIKSNTYCWDPSLYSSENLMVNNTNKIANFSEPYNMTNGSQPIPSHEGYSYECNYFGNPQKWIQFLYTNFLVLYLLPIVVMSITYGLIIRRVKETKMPNTNVSNAEKMNAFRKMESQNNESNGGPQKKKQKTPNIRHKVNIMCASLVLTFAICWLPFHAVHLARIRGIPIKASKGYICEALRSFGSLLGYANSLLNPLFYSFFGTDFIKRWTNARTTVKKNLTQPEGRANSKRKPNKAESCNCTKATVLSKPATKKLLMASSPMQKPLVNL